MNALELAEKVLEIDLFLTRDANQTADLLEAAPKLAKIVKLLRVAIEKSHKSHENLYVALWTHTALKPADDIMFKEVHEAIIEADKIAGE